jgi:hypothetical protein
LRLDARRYNLPHTTEVAAIFESVDGEFKKARDIASYPRFRKNIPLRIDSLSEFVDPFLYLIFFPLGDLGWSNGRDRVRSCTMRDYIAHRLAV